jgi:hypothetical protein
MLIGYSVSLEVLLVPDFRALAARGGLAAVRQSCRGAKESNPGVNIKFPGFVYISCCMESMELVLT